MDNQEQYTNPYYNQTIELKTEENNPSSDTVSNRFNSIIVGAGKNVFRVDERGQWMGSDKYETARFKVDMAGRLFASSAVITGTTATSTGSTRVEMNGPANEFRVYNAGVLVASLGAFDGSDGEMFNILYNSTDVHSPVYIRGNVPNAALAWFHNDGGERALVVSSDTDGASGALFVRNGTSITVGDGIAATFESNATDDLKPCVYIKGNTSGTALRLNGKLISDNIVPRSDNTYYLGNSSYKYAGIYVSSSTSTAYAGSVGGGGATSGDSSELTSGPGNLFAGHTHTIPAHSHPIPIHSHTINFNTVSVVINGSTYRLLYA